MPTFEDLATAVLAELLGGNPTFATGAHGQLAAYLAANGPQTVTIAATGRVATFKAYGASPGWNVTFA